MWPFLSGKIPGRPVMRYERNCCSISVVMFISWIFAHFYRYSNRTEFWLVSYEGLRLWLRYERIPISGRKWQIWSAPFPSGFRKGQPKWSIKAVCLCGLSSGLSCLILDFLDQYILIYVGRAGSGIPGNFTKGTCLYPNVGDVGAAFDFVCIPGSSGRVQRQVSTSICE